MPKYVITGGPCTGKTSLLEHLAEKGFRTIPEVARTLIAEEEAKARTISGYSPILPTTNLEQFEARCIERQVAQEAALIVNHKSNGTLRHAIEYTSKSRQVPLLTRFAIRMSNNYFLDRSLVDPIAYAELANVKLRPDIHNLLQEADYHAVFFLEQLPYYIQDKERLEDAVQAQHLHQKVYDVYDQLGYNIVRVPVFPGSKEESVAQRAEYILRHTENVQFTEIEKKYLAPHDVIRKALQKYQVQLVQQDDEENRIYDWQGILQRNDILLRLRTVERSALLTIKGPNRSRDVKKKMEINIPLPSFVGAACQYIPEDISYTKRRETYSPLGDSNCKICLDYLPQLQQEFVEIEAGSEHQVLQWEQRLGIGKYSIPESYPALVAARKTSDRPDKQDRY